MGGRYEERARAFLCEATGVDPDILPEEVMLVYMAKGPFGSTRTHVKMRVMRPAALAASYEELRREVLEEAGVLSESESVELVRLLAEPPRMSEMLVEAMRRVGPSRVDLLEDVARAVREELKDIDALEDTWGVERGNIMPGLQRALAALDAKGG